MSERKFLQETNFQNDEGQALNDEDLDKETRDKNRLRDEWIKAAQLDDPSFWSK